MVGMGGALVLLSLPAPLGEGWGGAPGCRLALCCRFKAGAGASSRQPSHFLLLRQKKVTKEKATPVAATLRFAAGNLRCSLFAGSAQTRLRLKHARPFVREKLRSSARPQGIWSPTRRGASLCGVRVGVGFGSLLALTLTHTLVLVLVLVLVLMLAFERARRDEPPAPASEQAQCTSQAPAPGALTPALSQREREQDRAHALASLSSLGSFACRFRSNNCFANPAIPCGKSSTSSRMIPPSIARQ
jgi:hypothetical protein